MAQSTAPHARVRLTVDQVHAMLEAGILAEGQPVELIDGMLVYKVRSARGEDPVTIGKKHNLVVKLLARLDAALGERGCHMQTQGPVRLSVHDEPEPDGAVLRGEPRDYTDRLPEAADVHCVIEVADASLAFDRTTKLALYARAGIRQYLIVNLRDGCIESYERPSVRGRYSRKSVLRAGKRAALALGDRERLEIDAAEILP
jgi:hypothetical protein